MPSVAILLGRSSMSLTTARLTATTVSVRTRQAGCGIAQEMLMFPVQRFLASVVGSSPAMRSAVSSILSGRSDAGSQGSVAQ